MMLRMREWLKEREQKRKEEEEKKKEEEKEDKPKCIDWVEVKRKGRKKVSFMKEAYESQCTGCEECKEEKKVEVLAVDEGSWEKMEMTVDSGAMETVAPTKTARNTKLRKTAATGRQYYNTANGGTMPNYGEKRLQWKSEGGSVGGITLQLTDVLKPLASVSQICEAGNRVVFEETGGYIENIKTGIKTPIRKAGKAYKLDLWVKAREKEDELMEVEISQGNEGPEDFSRQEIP